MDYESFIERKAQVSGYHGFDAIELPDSLFPFQKDMVSWALKKGRSAIFASCGLGKTIMQLVWAHNVVRKTSKPVLILSPLAVAFQTERESRKFGIESFVSRDGCVSSPITITNYEKLHLFKANDFIGAVCDESGVLKSYDAVRKNAIIDFMRKMPYRLLCSATPAPNDYVELGNSSEALGELGHVDMLNRFFRNNNNTSDMKGRYRGHHTPRVWEGKQWRFKGHAEMPFWRWVCSWARAIRKPSDLGYDDAAFELPPLVENEHLIDTVNLPEDMLFAMPAIGLQEQRAERRRTIDERCKKAMSLSCNKENQSLIWCHLNDEGDLLEKIVPDAVQVSGRDSDEQKELKFKGFISGDIRVMVVKPKIGAWGLNLQNCNHIVTFVDHSYESYYQGIRRCWRYGQDRTVVVDTVLTEGDRDVMKNLRRKSVAADRMFENLVACMHESMRVERAGYTPERIEVPSWL